ncbi:hypothetical protein AMTR_s00054p00203380 [Amborella trichopoda]|uniref:Uncharacterized protein n=1 Tax=Amborella trichopoda TaxID=13333 RepID=U5D7I6_AMBTC|nr:hypothetical protein AMTR_s00054p00203380 [Amborella trichopoda]
MTTLLFNCQTSKTCTTRQRFETAKSVVTNKILSAGALFKTVTVLLNCRSNVVLSESILKLLESILKLSERQYFQNM